VRLLAHLLVRLEGCGPVSVKEAPYYWIECDNCGERADYDEFSAMDTPDAAIDRAINSEWTEQGGRHHCPDCPVIADCEKCGKDAGELPGERDYLCQSCWDAAEEVQ
jgi:hypothetical protein